jgi:type IV pilus assembly protein PilW
MKKINYCKSKQKGMTLIELMISMAMGLLIIGAVVSVAVASMKTHKSIQVISKIQENSRFAYEFMARNIREAGGVPCKSAGGMTIANVLKNSPDNTESSVSNDDWASFVPLYGYQEGQVFAGTSFGTDKGDRVAGTDAIRISGIGDKHYQITDHNPPSAQFKISPENEDMQPGDILIACDFENNHQAIFQMTGPNAFNDVVVHNTGGSETPGNCSKGLGYPTECTTLGTQFEFTEGFIGKYITRYWFVGCNGREDCAKAAGRSLYFTSIKDGDSRNIEVVDSVNDLQVQYAVKGNDHYEDATDIADWSSVDSIEVKITFADEIGALSSENSNNIQRTFIYVIALRNRQS